MRVLPGYRSGVLLEVVQTLTEMGYTIRKAIISSDGGWFVDGACHRRTPTSPSHHTCPTTTASDGRIDHPQQRRRALTEDHAVWAGHCAVFHVVTESGTKITNTAALQRIEKVSAPPPDVNYLSDLTPVACPMLNHPLPMRFTLPSPSHAERFTLLDRCWRRRRPRSGRVSVGWSRQPWQGHCPGPQSTQ